jgi:hypothetical protein
VTCAPLECTNIFNIEPLAKSLHRMDRHRARRTICWLPASPVDDSVRTSYLGPPQRNSDGQSTAICDGGHAQDFSKLSGHEERLTSFRTCKTTAKPSSSYPSNC